MAANPTFFDGEFDLPKIEERVLAFWDERKIFEKSLKGKKQFVFYEGPPYANGKPGIHHVLARVVKDVMLRYKAMRGYRVPRRAGWDTHGLPAEMAAEKALGFKSKRDIEKYGVREFNAKAKEQVWVHKDEWERLTRRIGYWLDIENAYVTYEPEYIESVWWTMARLWKRKLLSKGFKVVPWCTRCGTALSSHELAQGYREVTDRSVYVKFKLKPGQRVGNFVADDATYVLSWTTTPWTLPGNVALAVGGEIMYVLVRTAAPDKASYIVAKDLAARIFADSDFAVMGEFPGRRLAGLEYEPLFDVAPLRGPESYRVHPAGFVTTTDGTGVVHTAVMYGEDDYALGKSIGLPEHHTVDEEGKFTKDVPGFAGDYVKAKETEEKITDHLKKLGYLFRAEAYAHEYPFCWRCGTPVLYYARTSWFILMSQLREPLLKSNKKINWMPEHVRDGRFGEWLREAKDWNLSRERYWGTPLPIWECGKCGHTEVADGMDALSRLAGGPKNAYWAMRHGEAEGNVFTIIDSGQMKFHLTPRGKKQAEASAARLERRLAKEHKKIDVVVSSDILRAKETAEIASGILRAPVVFDKRIEEIHLGANLTGKHVAEYWKRFPTYQDRFEKRLDGGESLRDVRVRMWAFLKDCEAKYAGKNILIVSHEDPIWMLSEIALGWSERQTADRKRNNDDVFIGLGDVIDLPVKIIPRNDTGEADLHRPFVDAVVFPCPQCKGAMKRVREVADVWYDSGAMPYAQAHFPFGKKKLAGAADPKPHAHIAYPADYIAEGMDQTRGWFYTLLAIATALGYEAPYKNVIALGLINDKLGQKMSKSKGNIVEPFSVIEKYGVDAVRWYFYAGTPFGEPKNFDEAEIAKSFRRTHLIVYNSLVFWKTYAVGAPGSVADAALKDPKNILDRWITARLHELIASTTHRLDRYEIREAALGMEAFIDDLSRWYIRRSRRRFQHPEDTRDHQAASATLGHALLSLVTLMAPFTPFFSEGCYRALRGKRESVHLEKWPEAEKSFTAGELIADMRTVRGLAAAGLAKRAEAGIKVRQPLASIAIGAELPEASRKILADEVNVKSVSIDRKLDRGAVALDTAITADLREEGLLRDVVRMVQELRQKAGLQPKDKIVVMLDAPAEVKNAVSKHEQALASGAHAASVEYRRSDKFDAEEAAKLDGREIWVALRKI